METYGRDQGAHGCGVDSREFDESGEWPPAKTWKHDGNFWGGDGNAYAEFEVIMRVNFWGEGEEL
jgi:hypothetical protein